MKVLTIPVPELGNRCYLVYEDKQAIIIDPPNKIAELIKLIKQNNLCLRAVFETHIHNDYLSGGYRLAEYFKAKYYLKSQQALSFKYQALEDQTKITIGKISILALASAGHTPDHLSYFVTSPKVASGYLFSGGSLLYGTVGRTDLINDAQTKKLAHAQYQTAWKFINNLPADSLLYPTHGFGSFCAASNSKQSESTTLAQEKMRNIVFKFPEPELFINDLLKNYDDYPSYYKSMALLNTQPNKYPIEPLSKIISLSELKTASHQGLKIVDLRSRLDYAKQHYKPSYNIEYSKQLATYLGWLIDRNQPVALISQATSTLGLANKNLDLIGYQAKYIYSTSAKNTSLYNASYPVVNYEQFKKLYRQPDFLLDVRSHKTWQKSHLNTAYNIPFQEITTRITELPLKSKIWVYAETGFKAAIASSILSSANLRPHLINDDFNQAIALDLVAITQSPIITDIISKKAILIDVREVSLFKTSRAVGAISLPLGQILNNQLSKLDITKKIYSYCDYGEKSAMAVNVLNSLGFQAEDIGSLADWQILGGQLTNQPLSQ